ncbi:capsid cement protein [Brachybacterium hainanense]|uniref:Capsid cement protein n=1 Tax=Brachybacterium hainanense TaxID=1541174 RepID=A0ABV6R985_9MICO
MARNEQFRHANHISLPVPAGTASGDPVRVGILNGVAQTNVATADDWAGGNALGHATVWLDGSHVLPVAGAVTEVGAPIYIADGSLSATAGGALYGAALATQAADGSIPVRIIPATPDAA